MLYPVLTAALLNPAADVGAKVETFATTHVTDGLWMGRATCSSPTRRSAECGCGRRTGRCGWWREIPRLRWPDSMADGSIYITASHIQDMVQSPEHGSTQRGPWGLFRIPPPHG